MFIVIALLLLDEKLRVSKQAHFGAKTFGQGFMETLRKYNGVLKLTLTQHVKDK